MFGQILSCLCDTPSGTRVETCFSVVEPFRPKTPAKLTVHRIAQRHFQPLQRPVKRGTDYGVPSVYLQSLCLIVSSVLKVLGHAFSRDGFHEFTN